jgi:hypothetical protein
MIHHFVANELVGKMTLQILLSPALLHFVPQERRPCIF